MSDQTSVFDDNQEPTKAPEAPAQQQQQEPAQEPAQQQQQAQQQPTAPSDGVFADQLASIRNERGEPKYKDLPTALEALKHSQEYIPQVKQENESLKTEIERLKAELGQRESLEETVQRLTAQRKEDQPTPQELQGLTPEQVEELLEQRLNEREQLSKAKENAQSVEQAIIKKYGDKAREVVQAKSQEFGMSVQEMQQWASKNPKAVLALFEVKPSPQGTQPYSSSVNIPPVKPSDSQDELPKPDKSLLRGASTRDLMDYMRKSREHTNKRLGVTS